MSDSDREQAERGSLILHRLVPAPDHGRGFRRDPETSFVYYSSEWLSDVRHRCPCSECGRDIYISNESDLWHNVGNNDLHTCPPLTDAKPSE